MEEQTPAAGAPSLEQQIAEAEERGYRRGLNEQIAAKMNEPGMWESASRDAAPEAAAEGFRILDSRRKSIWEL